MSLPVLNNILAARNVVTNTDMPTRVLVWHWGRRGAGPKYTFELASALRKCRGLHVELTVSRQSEIFADFLRLDVPQFLIDTYTGKMSATLSLLRLPFVRQRFANMLQERRFDVVVCTMNHLWDVPMLGAVRAAGARFLLTLHDAVPHPGENYLVNRWLLAREIRAADGIVALTDSVRRTLCETYGYPEQRTWVVPHGAFAYHRAETARRYPRGRPFRLLFFGRLLPYKGLPLLFEAYRELLGEGNALTLTVAGRGDLSPYRQLARDLPGLTVDNRWIPEDEIGGFFADADLLIVPYVEASQSGVITTAYAAGLPVVVTPVGGLSEQVADGTTGLVAAEASAFALAQTIRRLMSDPALYERCSVGALGECRSRLDWSSVAACFAAAFQQVQAMPAQEGT